MRITEESLVDSINVIESGHVQVRRVTRVMKDGEAIAKTYHRHVLSPGDDLANEDPKVQAIAKAAWTKDVISGHQTRIAEQDARFGPPPDSPLEEL